jgi:hypothetical protein
MSRPKARGFQDYLLVDSFMRFAAQKLPNGKAEAQRRVYWATILNKLTNKTKKPRYNERRRVGKRRYRRSPLRTVRASLHAHGSSISNALRNKTRFPNMNSMAMNLPVAIRV